MKVLVVHNYYQQAGGEDMVFHAETQLLRDHGHDVQTFTMHNNDLATQSPVTAGARTVWNPRTARDLARRVARDRVDVVHVHNTFPMISPSIYRAARWAGAATVQTLHNYRLLCGNGLLYRDGAVCRECVNRVPIPAIVHRCYRDSAAASAAVALMQVVHRAVGTYSRDIDAFIALTPFAREVFLDAGLPAERVHVKPNFLPRDPGIGPGGEYALFVGRLTPEKGVATLLTAWETLGRVLPLVILGDGPLAPAVRRAAESTPGITYLGHRSRDEVLQYGQRAAALMLSSEWFEGGLPLTAVEALASGAPVVAARIGAGQSEIVEGVTGFHFAPGDPADLTRAVLRFMDADHAALRRNARAAFEATYTRERGHDQLLAVYATALANRHGGSRPA